MANYKQPQNTPKRLSLQMIDWKQAGDTGMSVFWQTNKVITSFTLNDSVMLTQEEEGEEEEEDRQ